VGHGEGEVEGEDLRGSGHGVERIK
jgi:hypothetical protein